MSEIRPHSEEDRVVGELARKASISLKDLQNKVVGKEANPWLAEKTNFKLIEEDVSPIVRELVLHRKNIETKSSETGIRVDFGLRPKYDPRLREQSKFVVFDGIKLALYSSMGDRKDDLIFHKEIRREQDLDRHEGKEADKNINSFRRMSKRDVLAGVIFTIESFVPSDAMASAFNPKSEHKHDSPAIIKSNSDPDLDHNLNLILDIKDFFANMPWKKTAPVDKKTS